ncbi:cytolytic toxin-beta-like, partial [Engraulis encrasicolus]|uniref:cytolytic toxin-beta-like n=1 Tax=Engraulis encrasicolus TaxID=184585 RepID=UPI002FD5E423
LDLSDNDLQDSGVELLSSGLQSSHCTLQTLRLSFCGVTERGCEHLASALISNPSHLRELDLSYNYPGDAGVQLLSQRKDDPTCTLTTINVENSAECWMKSALRKYAREVMFDKDTMHRQLYLTDGERKVCCRFTEHDYPLHPHRFAGIEQVLANEGFRQRCYWEAEWAGFRVYLGMTHRGVERNGDHGRLGHNNKSWALRCYYANDDYENSYTAFHDDQGTAITSPGCALCRVGVFLDWDAGTLSFYAVSGDTLVHLHTFRHNFQEDEEDLVPGVLFVSDVHTEDSVLLCKVE